MKHFKISVPDNKYTFFMELVDSLDFIKVSEHPIPEEHKNIVRERIKNSNPRTLVDWEKAKKKIKFG